MTSQEAAKLLKQINEELVAFRLKKKKFSRYALIALIIGSVFLASFIACLIIFLLNPSLSVGQILTIVFLVLALVTYQLAIVFHLFSRYLYGQKAEVREKILINIEKTLKK